MSTAFNFQGPPLERREFLKRAVQTLAATSALGPILAACSSSGGPAGNSAASNLVEQALAPYAPDHPITLPIFPGNEPIASGLAPEKGATLSLYNWSGYICKDLLDAFGAKYQCKVQVTSFGSYSEARTKLQNGGVFDIFFPGPDLIGRLCAAQLIRPLNHDYIPNLANVWPVLQNPYFDSGSFYSVPYTVSTTGIGFRADKVDDPGALTNPWDIFWDRALTGMIYVIDDARQALQLPMQRDGLTDLNPIDPEIIDKAKTELIDAVNTVNLKFGYSAFRDIPEGRAYVAQAYSGDMVNAKYFLPKGTSTDALGFWRPAAGGVASNDSMVIVRSGHNPVLAHLFLDWMLDEKNAIKNFEAYTGYQPPITAITPDRLIADGVVPASLPLAIVTEDVYKNGSLPTQIPRDAQKLYEDAFAEVKAGM